MEVMVLAGKVSFVVEILRKTKTRSPMHFQEKRESFLA